MKLQLLRYSTSEESTLGILYKQGIDRLEMLCYTLEDTLRYLKVSNKTRIPSGKYDLILRNHGGFNARYKNKFGETWHNGMIEVEDVNGFSDVLIHIGNDDEDTSGCILLGNKANNNQIKDGFISSSTDAYKCVYPQIKDALVSGEHVSLDIKDLEHLKLLYE